LQISENRKNITMKNLIYKLTHGSALVYSALFLFALALPGTLTAASCTLEAEPKLFSPNGDGSKDSVFFVPSVEGIKRINTWELRITDSGGQPIKSFTGKKVLPKILTWEGQTESSGTFVFEGKYLCQFLVCGNGSKKAISGTVEIIADLTPPEVQLVVSSNVFMPSIEDAALVASVTFYVSISDSYGIDNWLLSVRNSRQKDVKVFRSTQAVPTGIIWDGNDDYYGAPVPNGKYTARCIVWDNAGNKMYTSAPLLVESAPREKEVIKESTLMVKEEACGLAVNLSTQILFGKGSNVLKTGVSKILDEVLNLLQAYPDNHVSITGHTDSLGSRESNKFISSERAWAIYSYLVKHGVAPSRFTGNVKGAGSSAPVATNKTKQGRARNSRIEIIILKKAAP
jgi:outer membrane protein OmpA-like peptidoglycan-associated protein